MTTNRAATTLCCVAWLTMCGMPACGTREPRTVLLDSSAQAPADVRHGCELAMKRCVQCHSIERILRADIDQAQNWAAYVHRMRLQPGSGIFADEEPLIVKCLDYRWRPKPPAAPVHDAIPATPADAPPLPVLDAEGTK